MIILGILTISMLSVSPAFTKKGKTVFSANGKITDYAPGISPGSEIVDGQWNLKIVEYGYATDGGVAYFQAYYKELNLDEGLEQSPEGTIDHFKISYTDHYDAVIDGNVVRIRGTRHCDKKMWLLDDTGAPIEWIEDFIVSWVMIEVDLETGEFRMDNYPIGSWPSDGWDIYGTVLSAH